MAELYTTLGLGGVPRAAPFLAIAPPAEGNTRPDVGTVTVLGVAGIPIPPQQISDKAAAGSDTRPDIGAVTALGVYGGPAPPQLITSKLSAVGLVGRTTVQVVAQVTLRYGRRSTIVPSISTSIRPQGVMIFAHRTSIIGSNRVTVEAAAITRYTRSGTQRQFNGGTEVNVTTFGSMRYHPRRGIVGAVSVGVTPAANLDYTPAPIRNHVLHGSSRVAITPASAVQYQAGGTDYSIQGTNSTQVTPQGRVTVVRETTYALRGSVQVAITVSATLIKTQGAPQSFAIQGSVTSTVKPNGRMGVQTGIIKQYFLSGQNRVVVSPVGRMQPSPAVPLDSDGALLELQPKTRRRLVRVHR